jgi:transcriptional regulator with XRE-family HTH domain
MISKKVTDYLRAEYDSGMTQQEIAEKHNIIQSHIQKILSGERRAGGITLQTLDKMFPQAEIYLDGNTQTINASGNANVAQTISGNIDQSRHASGGTNTLDKILTRVLDHDEFNAEEKVKFMKFLKAIEEVE